ncbi:hypothetical protein TNCV_2607401 [Trichonephila clavipes]|uniref:Uncharacterized protein n=1 Tax=Trichonephila clavipes TaxID=2585209 RepID=A0A8X6RVT2_TRICX|nr:hypothetical protein TNCV_2607401 [Trichonephila clavipes]
MHHGEKKGAIASRRLDLYLLVRGRYFIFLLSPIGNQLRRSHLGTHPLGVTGSPRVPPLVVVVVLVTMNKCIMEKKRWHSLQEVGLLPVGPRKVFYFPIALTSSH